MTALILMSIESARVGPIRPWYQGSLGCRIRAKPPVAAAAAAAAAGFCWLLKHGDGTVASAPGRRDDRPIRRHAMDGAPAGLRLRRC